MVPCSTMIDYYKELGVHRHATSSDIRTAYKRLALVWHPDRNKAKDAEEKFKKIKQAYDILIDDQRRREYDHERQQQKIWFEKTHRKSYPTNEDQFNLQTFENLMANPIDPFDILNDIQMFQDSDFTSKMMNSPSYRNLYIHLFNSMNNHHSKINPYLHSSTPIYMNNDRLFRSNPKSSRSKQQSNSSIKPIPVIHSTMPNDWFLNELIDLHEQQNYKTFSYDRTHCKKCHKKISSDRARLIQHENQCQINSNKQYTTIPSKSVPA